jgi:hypothetical protein
MRWILAMVLFVSGSAWADEPYVSRARFEALVEQASTPDFRIPNEPVIFATLNKLIDTPGKRVWARKSLSVREHYRGVIEAGIAEHGMPEQLAAIPLIEAGYRNLGSDDPIDQVPYELGPVGRGLWMFIRPTGRAFGLRIDDETDQRLDVPAATDAAMQYLAKLHDRFGDWGLAFAAYHRGPTTVRRAMNEHGSRSPWRLIEAGALNRYAAKIMAAALVLEDPSLVHYDPAEYAATRP